MPLKINDPAPNFTLEGTDGPFTLSEHWSGKAGIIYFYPKDFTPGCTAEACEFRDQFAAFREADVPVVGISQDSVATHRRFQAEHDLPFPLLADVGGKVSRLYKAVIPFVGVTNRVTYLLDADHRVRAAHEELFGGKRHVDEMLKVLG